MSFAPVTELVDPYFIVSTNLTPLMRAIVDGNVEEALLQVDTDDDLDRQDKHGQSALLYALVHEQYRVVYAMLRRDVDAEAASVQGTSPLGVAHHQQIGSLIKRIRTKIDLKKPNSALPY